MLTIQASWLDKTGVPKVATIKSGLINQAANPELQAAAVSPVTVNLLQNLLAAVLNA